MDYQELVSDEWDFGNDRELADRLKKLVLSGKKTATTGLYKKGAKVPRVGDYAAILGSDKKRFCIIQYTNISIKPFLDVGYEWVKLEGEGDINIEEWRGNFKSFFVSELERSGNNFLVICEEFRLTCIPN